MTLKAAVVPAIPSAKREDGNRGEAGRSREAT